MKILTKMKTKNKNQTQFRKLYLYSHYTQTTVFVFHKYLLINKENRYTCMTLFDDYEYKVFNRH